MQSSLADIRKAIKGMIVMSSDLDAMYTSFLNNQLPRIWERASFASLKSLGSWVTDLVFRVKFMRQWLVHGQPAAFPLPVFFFPQVFTFPLRFSLVSVLPTVRKHRSSFSFISPFFSSSKLPFLINYFLYRDS